MSVESFSEKPTEPHPWSGTAVSGFILSVLGLLLPFGSIAAILVSGIALAFTGPKRKRGRVLAWCGLVIGGANVVLGVIVGGTAGWQAAQGVIGQNSFSKVDTAEEYEDVTRIADGFYLCVSSNTGDRGEARVADGEPTRLTAYGPVAMDIYNRDGAKSMRNFLSNGEYADLDIDSYELADEKTLIVHTSYSHLELRTGQFVCRK